MTECSVDDCFRNARGRGWCQTHYKRWLETGDVQAHIPIAVRSKHATLEDAYLSGLPGDRNPNKCWEWQGLRSHYGLVCAKGEREYAHRYSWTRANGRPISDGEVVRHTCDNKFCVNPAHLITGSQADNVQDAVERRLHAFGERHGRGRLNEEQVREIKRLLLDGQLTYKQIAARFPVITRKAVESIASGKTWGWVEPAAA